MPSFTKTRMVYYDNQVNTLTRTNVNTAITLNTFDAKDHTQGYGVARLKGTTHNWSFIPINKYGLYMSANEFYYLFHSASKIIPKHMKVCLGHTVPIAKYPGTANTTQLSFNNTIYSLIYELSDLSNVNTEAEFASTDDFIDFRRTYDGAKYSNGHRNNLTKPDVIYKFPDYALALNSLPYTSTVKFAAGTAPGSTTIVPDQDVSLTRLEIAQEFIPEFLKDNNNVYVLYPGENQYEYEETIGTSDYVTIDCNAQQFNESQGVLDIRGGYHVNSDAAFKENDHLYQEIVPRVRYNGFLPDDDSAPNPNDLKIVGKRRLDQYYNQDTGCLSDRGPLKIFIKGNPILDESNNLVSHTFQALITWTLNVDIIPRIEPIPRNIIEGYCVLRKQLIRDAAVNTSKAVFSFTKPYPLRLQNQNFKGKPSKYNRLVLDPSVSTYTSSTIDDGTWEYNPVDFHRGSIKGNVIHEEENFNKVTPPASTITQNNANRLEPME